MRKVATVAATVLAGSAHAAEQGALDAAATRLTITYQCAGITGNADAYEAAKSDARERLPIAAANQMIAIVEAQEQVGATVTEQLCVDLLRLTE